MSIFAVETPQEVHVLWRLVFDAKFQTEMRDEDLWSSPWVHDLARRIDQAQFESYELEGRPDLARTHLERRRSFFQNPFVLNATTRRLKAMAKTDWWKKQPDETLLAFVRGCVAPYELEDDELLNLVRGAEA